MRLIEDGTYIVDVSEADLDKIKRVMLDTGKFCTLMYPHEGRNEGEWVKRYKELDLCTAWWYECSECGYKPVNSMLTAFCPSCGAEMKGAEDVENDKP